MNELFLQQFQSLPQYLSAHTYLSLSVMLVSILIFVPLGIACAKNTTAKIIALSIVSILQTVPSLAFLALMVPIIGQIGWTPAFIALLMYSALPILRNTISGVAGIDPKLLEVGKAQGMSSTQRLFMIELPLALPIIIAGIRTSMIWTIGTATLATPVGADSLGYYIFLGLNTRQTEIIIFGCIFSAAIALLFDQIIAILEKAATKRSTFQMVLGLSSLSLAFFLSLGWQTQVFDQSQPSPASSTTRSKMAHFSDSETAKENLTQRPPDKPDLPLAGKSYVIGAKNFTEQYILAELIAIRLRELGASSTTPLTGLGSKIAFDALSQSKIDLYVDYTGTIWSTVMKKTQVIGKSQANILTASALLENYGIISYGRLGFENAYAFAMNKKQAANLGIRDLNDLAARSSGLIIGGDFDFFGRPEGKHALDTYGLQFLKKITMNSRLMYDALETGQVDVVTAYTSDGQIAFHDLYLIEDPKQALPPYEAILLLSPTAAEDTDLQSALQLFIGSIDTPLMRSANKQVDINKKPISEVAHSLYKILVVSKQATKM